MAPLINPDVLDTATPPIPEARQWLAAYDGRHGPAINLSQAVPGTPPPLDLLERLAVAAGDPAMASYGPIQGEPALLEVYAEHVTGLYGAEITPPEVAITPGCNAAFVMTIQSIARAGDAVLLPVPWYFNHQMTLGMLGIAPVPLPTDAEQGFVPDPCRAGAILAADARQTGGGRIKAIVLVTPNNPTGAVIAPDILAAFAALADEYGCWLVLDETYRDFLGGADARPHALFKQPELRHHIIQLYSFSKAYAIPGHRVGAIVAAPAVMTEIAKVLDCVQICAPRAAQTALTWAIPALQPWRQQTASDINRRAALFKAGLAAAPDWQIKSIGAYFAYLQHPDGARPSHAVAERLAREKGVLALPGSYFGPDQGQMLRFAFANVDDRVAAQVGRRIA